MAVLQEAFKFSHRVCSLDTNLSAVLPPPHSHAESFFQSPSRDLKRPYPNIINLHLCLPQELQEVTGEQTATLEDDRALTCFCVSYSTPGGLETRPAKRARVAGEIMASASASTAFANAALGYGTPGRSLTTLFSVRYEVVGFSNCLPKVLFKGQVASSRVISQRQ